MVAAPAQQQQLETFTAESLEATRPPHRKENRICGTHVVELYTQLIRCVRMFIVFQILHVFTKLMKTFHDFLGNWQMMNCV